MSSRKLFILTGPHPQFCKENKEKNWVRADFSTRVNDCLKDHSYPLTSPEDIFAKQNGSNVFSKIDLSDACLQIEVDHECSKVLTISTRKGLYRLNRPPFGLKVVTSLFQQVKETMLAGLDFTIVYLDDILIKSENNNQHCDQIKEVFRRIDDYGFKLCSEVWIFHIPN